MTEKIIEKVKESSKILFSKEEVVSLLQEEQKEEYIPYGKQVLKRIQDDLNLLKKDYSAIIPVIQDLNNEKIKSFMAGVKETLLSILKDHEGYIEATRDITEVKDFCKRCIWQFDGKIAYSQKLLKEMYPS